MKTTKGGDLIPTPNSTVFHPYVWTFDHDENPKKEAEKPSVTVRENHYTTEKSGVFCFLHTMPVAHKYYAPDGLAKEESHWLMASEMLEGIIILRISEGWKLVNKDFRSAVMWRKTLEPWKMALEP